MTKQGDHFHVECPQCRASVKARRDQVDKQITCPDCLEDFVVSRPANPDPAEEIPAGDDDLWNPADGDSAPDPFGSEMFSDSSSTQEPGIWDSQWEETREQLEAILRPDMTKPPPGSSPPPASSGGSMKPRGQDRGKRARAPAANEPYDFTVPCPLCGTRLDSASEKIGTRMRCPDCYSSFEIREPPVAARRVRSEKASRPDDELRLSDADSMPVLSPPSHNLPREDFPPLTPATPTKSRPTITPVDAIRDTLTRAKKEVEEEEKQRPALPARPLTTGIFRFLFEPRAIGRWVILSFLWQVEVSAIQGSLSSADGGGLSQMISVVLRMFAVIVGALLMGQTMASCQIIAEESAAGRDVIEGWPGMNVAEWFFDSWTLFASLFLSLAPAVLLGQIAYTSGGGFSAFLLFLLGIGGPMLVFVYPVLLLSFLENNLPYSPVVWRSLSDAGRHWGAFWLLSAVLVAAGCLMAWIALTTSSYVLSFLAVAGGMLTTMVYFRLFGRFSWACEDLLAERDQRLREAEMTQGRR